MQYRPFADTASRMSLLGFGTMRLPVIGEKQSDIDEQKALQMIDYAYENGVNYFDTAHVYHGGNSETFIGKALGRYRRESYNLSTKMPPWQIKKESDVQKIFDGQLRKCGVDYFDYYLMHCIDRETMPTFEKFGIYDFLRGQQKKGKLRHLGFSMHDNVEMLEKILGKWEMEFALMQINYLDWDGQNAKGLYQTATGRGLPVFVMEPVRGGTLAALCPDSAEILRKAAPERSIASWALRFAAGLPGVVSILSGMSTIEQVKDNVATCRDFTPLTPAEREVLERAVETYRKKATVPCTACRYCVPCPAGVDIPHAFTVYNTFKKTGNRGAFRMHYDMIGEGNQPNDCTQCGQCVSLCPQHLDIPKWMDEIAEAVKQK